MIFTKIQKKVRIFFWILVNAGQGSFKGASPSADDFLKKYFPKKVKNIMALTFLFFKVMGSDFQDFFCLFLIRSFPESFVIGGIPRSTIGGISGI